MCREVTLSRCAHASKVSCCRPCGRTTEGSCSSGRIAGSAADLLGFHQQLQMLERTGNTNGPHRLPTWTHSRMPIEVMTAGCAVRLFQALQAASLMSS